MDCIRPFRAFANAGNANGLSLFQLAYYSSEVLFAVDYDAYRDVGGRLNARVIREWCLAEEDQQRDSVAGHCRELVWLVADPGIMAERDPFTLHPSGLKPVFIGALWWKVITWRSTVKSSAFQDLRETRVPRSRSVKKTSFKPPARRVRPPRSPLRFRL